MADNNYYDDRSDMQHIRRDVRDAHTNSELAKWLSIIALVVAGIALAVSWAALDKAGQAQSTANRATESSFQSR
jgi:hypothetical protein